MLRKRPEKPIHFLDLGSGRNVRVNLLAEKHPEKRFVSVDAQTRHTVNLQNLEHHRKDAMNYLKEQPDNSIRIINADFSIRSIRSMKHFDVEGNYIPAEKKLFEEIHRVLKKPGSFFLTTMDTEIPLMKKLLHAAGFSVNVKPINELLLPNKRLLTYSETLANATPKELENIYRLKAIAK